ncbi:MAG: SpoIIIAH-like family protein [Ruminococcaceae bacterium]|nr:SpoIIIAH-like family protein [Oscillospiraceae bacterium]
MSMKRFFGKKQVLVATLAVALGLAVYLNYYLAQNELKSDTATGGNNTTTTTGGHLGDSQYVSGTTTVPAEQTGSTTVQTPYFKQARESREAARAESLQMLQELVNDVKSSQAVIDDATEKILAAAEAGERESAIESLVKAKGFADCVAYIEGDRCNVVVLSEGLTGAQTLQITEIITAQSSIKPENIKISSVKS